MDRYGMLPAVLATAAGRGPQLVDETGTRRRGLQIVFAAGFAAALTLGVFPGVAAAQSSGISPGLVLVVDEVEVTSQSCTDFNVGVFEFLVSGPATSGDAVGTFEETIIFDASEESVQPTFHAEFTVELDDGRTITGEKSLPAPGASYASGIGCAPDVFTGILAIGVNTPYTATTTDEHGHHTETGISQVEFEADFLPDGVVLHFSGTQSFAPGEVVSTVPTSADQCKRGGWVDFGFRNQGQCIRFVNTGQDSR